MKVKTMNDLLMHELKDLYSAESQLVGALPKMAKAATSENLRAAFEEHLEQTKTHKQRLERIFEGLEGSPRGMKCHGMVGLVEEGKEMMGEDIEDESVRDAALIVAAQKVEHYEIAGYGSARYFAEMLGMDEAARLLEETLEEEKQTDQRLNELAKSEVNVEAAERAA